MGIPCHLTPEAGSSIVDIPSVTKALEVIHSALEKYCTVRQPLRDGNESPLNLNKILVAFNGGKDCTLLLHLILMIVAGMPNLTGAVRLMYIKDSPEETFPEVADFVERTKRDYNLESIEVDSGNMKSALEKIVKEHPEVEGIFMGTRSTDPNAGWMDYFCQTSPGWPKVDLIAPLLHMSYSEVWTVMSALNIPYCEMYDRGYTSIGARSNTIPNPLLRVSDTDRYLPASQLEDESKERFGRK